MTQAELAQKAGISEISIRKYETGERKPKYETVLKIANALDVQTKDLFSQDTPHEIISLFYGVDTFKRKLTESNLTDDENKLLLSFNVLNSQGKQEALKRVDELTEIKKYTDPD